MGVLAAVWAYSTQLGRCLWRLGQSLAALNNSLIPAVFRCVSQACQAVYAFGSLLCNSLAEILVYILNVVIDAARVFLVIGEAFGKLTLVIVHILLSAYHIIEELAGYVAHGLLFCLRGVGNVFTELVEKSGLSFQNLGKWLGSVLATIVDSLSSGAQNVREYSVYSLTAAHNYTFHTTCAGATIIRNWFWEMYDASCIVTSYVYSEILKLCSSVLQFVRKIIPRLESLSPDIYLSLVITISTIICLHIFITVMRKKGLTVPFFSYSSARNREVFLRYMPQTDANFVVSDDEEVDLEEDDDSTSTSTTHSDRTEYRPPDNILDWLTMRDDNIEVSDVEDSEEDIQDSTSVDEFEINEDSDFESGDENDQNAINIQLPERRDPYSLRQRATPARSLSKLSPGEIEHHLETERDKRLCVVCQDQQKNVLVLPCRHMCMCIECAHEIVGAVNPIRRVCPLCRSVIDTVMNVYL